MERLTERDDKGNLLFNGKQVYAGDFYEAVSCLEEYEDTGLTPPEIMELAERDAAKKIEINAGIPTCPVCGRRIVKCYDFCPDCGQRMEQYEEE